MLRIQQLRQQRHDAVTSFREMLDRHLEAARPAAGPLRAFTDEEKAAQAAAERTIADLDAHIAAEQRRLDLETAAVSREADADERAQGQDPGRRPRVSAGPPNLERDPRRGFASPRAFLMAVIEEGSGLRDRADIRDERLRYLAVFDKDDKRAAGELAFMLPVGFTPRGLAPMAAAGSDEAGEYDDRYGGFLPVVTRLPGLLQVGFEGDPTAGLTQDVPMQSPTVEMPARVDKDHTSSVSGGFVVTRRPETVVPASSRAQFEMVTLKATSLFGLSYATEEILADSPLSFVAIIDAGFRTQFGAHMLNEKLRGRGGNEFLGVLTALESATAGPTITVAKEGSQTNDTINSTNVVKMAARCWGFGSAIWLANHDTKPQLYTLSITVGTAGTLIYQPSREVGFPDMLLGRPIYYTEFASKLGDLGDIGLYNWSQFLEGTYQPLQSAESVHVRFLNHERTFKFWLRNAGAPWWRTPLTPNQSPDTLSPFVVLQAR